MLKNKFFIFEGIDGSGKTTLIEKLKKKLSPQFFFFTKEPCGTDISCEITKLLKKTIEKNDHLTHYLTFAMERSYHIKNYIIPALNEKNVISDRFFYSSLAYQGNHIESSIIENIYNLTNNNIFINTIFYCKIKPEVAIERIKKRSTNTFLDSIYEKQLKSINNRFNTIFDKLKEKKNIVILDMENSIEDLVKTVIKNL